VYSHFYVGGTIRPSRIGKDENGIDAVDVHLNQSGFPCLAEDCEYRPNQAYRRCEPSLERLANSSHSKGVGAYQHIVFARKAVRPSRVGLTLMGRTTLLVAVVEPEDVKRRSLHIGDQTPRLRNCQRRSLQQGESYMALEQPLSSL
jgi:hypothetical protein